MPARVVSDRPGTKSFEPLRDVACHGESPFLNALFGDGPFPPGHALLAKFYRLMAGESIAAKCRLWVLAGTTRTRLDSSALVGKPPNTLGPCLTASG